MVLHLHIAQYVPVATSPSSNIHFSRNTFLWAWIGFGFRIARDKYMPTVMLFIIAGQHFRKNRVFVFHIRGCWWHRGTLAVHVSLTSVTRVRPRIHAVICLKLSGSHLRRVLLNLSLPSIAGFLRVLRYPPTVTLNPWEVDLTAPLDRTAQMADRVIQYK